jgi:hypothetical protein
MAPDNASYRCDLCWATFDTEAELVVHVAEEETRSYPLDVDLTEGDPAWN